jgi:hypothetical protein
MGRQRLPGNVVIVKGSYYGKLFGRNPVSTQVHRRFLISDFNVLRKSRNRSGNKISAHVPFQLIIYKSIYLALNFSFCHSSPKFPEDAPKFPEDAPKFPEDAPKFPEDAPKFSENVPKFPEDAPEFPEDAPKFPEDAPEFTEDAPEFPEDAPEFPDDVPEFPKKKSNFVAKMMLVSGIKKYFAKKTR